MSNADQIATLAPALPAGVTWRAGFEVVEQCDLCGGRRQRAVRLYPEYLLFTGERFRLVRCEDCGLHFLNPRPSEAIIGEYYPDDYAAHVSRPPPVKPWHRRVGAAGAAPLGLLQRIVTHVRQSVQWYFLPRFEGGGRALDIGCGNGKLLHLLRSLGWETYGVETSSAVARRASEDGHTVVVGRAEDRHFDHSFDLVYLWHVLEHTHHPARVLQQIFESLRPGGRLDRAGPNRRSVPAALFGRYWWSTDAPRHLYQFDRRVLARYLEQAGFVDVRMTTRTGATSWVRGFRHTVNGWFGLRLGRDPQWMIDVADVGVAASALFRFFGAGSELRVECRRPG